MNLSKERSCDNKVNYYSEYHGIRELRIQILDNREKINLHVYKCEYCECWHIGHRSKLEAKEIELFIKHKQRPLSKLVRMK